MQFVQMCTLAPQIAKLNLTPLKAKLSQELPDSSELSSPVLKSTISATTMDSPLASPRKSYTLEEEDEVCSFFEEGCCSLGSQCEFEHARCNTNWKRSFMLENYPELVMARPSRRPCSFLP